MVATRQQQSGGRLLIQRYPFLATAVAIGLIVGVIWLIEGGAPGESAGASTAVTLAGNVGGTTPKVGELAPNFKLEALDRTTLQLSDLRGRPVVLNFWATWCPPCRAEMPDLEALWREYKDQGLVIVGINFGEDRASAQQFADALKLTFPIVLDQNAAVANRYNLTGLPTTYFVNRDGTIRYMNIGALTIKKLRERVAGILQ